MNTIKKFFECTVPVSSCNLRCSYCYVMQENRRDIKTDDFILPPEEIGRAFAKTRTGGISLFNLCGFGETLIPEQMPEIIYYLLKEGHFVNVTNNGTMTERIKEMMGFPREYLSRLCFSFSFHYLELIKRDKLQTFIENVKLTRSHGCSAVIQLNMADEYMERIEEIKELCRLEFGAYPQIALTRKESPGGIPS